MAKLTQELTEAILKMPSKEKDKLLLRLIAKDEKLVAKLEFELLSGQDDMLLRRNAIKRAIFVSSWSSTPGWIMMDMRDFSGRIREHIRITKDKLGEVLLSVDVLYYGFKNNLSLLQSHTRNTETFAEYVVKKAGDTLKKAEKLHPDYYMEFRDHLNQVLEWIHAYPPSAPFIKEYALPKIWDEG
jgi:hypothetical protein